MATLQKCLSSPTHSSKFSPEEQVALQADVEAYMAKNKATKNMAEALVIQAEIDTLVVDYTKYEDVLVSHYEKIGEKVVRREGAKATDKTFGGVSRKAREHVSTLLKKSDDVGGVTLAELINLSIKDPGRALLIVKNASQSTDVVIEGLRNKGLAALSKIPKKDRPAAGENIETVISSLEAKPGVLFSLKLHSTLLRAAQTPKFPGKLPAKSVINQLKKQQGVKQAEIDAVGLPEWLEGKDKVAKEELVQFLELNRVLVTEDRKGIEEIEPGEEFDEGDTAFMEYTLSGGEPGTYVELLLKRPTDKGVYTTSHWPGEIDTIAHIRGDVRSDVEGTEVFHVAEFQSDLYSEIVDLESKVDPSEPIGLRWKLAYSDGQQFGGSYESKEDALAEAAALNEGRESSLVHVDSYGFEKGFQAEVDKLKALFPWGDSWPELVAKQMISYAVETGINTVSWDTAATQTERWESALRQKIDTIEWEKGKGDRKGQVVIHGFKQVKTYRQAVFSEWVPLEGSVKLHGEDTSLAKLIGKEMATKIVKSSEGTGDFSGENLTIGGEFYKIVYDQKIPGFLKKYGKKWGAKVGMAQVMTDEGEKIDVHTFDMPAGMIEDIREAGQTTFSENKAKAAEASVATAQKELEEKIGKTAYAALVADDRLELVTGQVADMVTGMSLSTRGVQGFYTGGKVYLIPENIDKGKAWNVFMHEIGVHRGYKEIFGEKLAKEVFSAFATKRYNDDKLGKAIYKAFARVPASTRIDMMSEEALAYFIEEQANTELSLMKKIIARVRMWAVKYLGIDAGIFTYEDYIAIAIGAARKSATDAIRSRRAPQPLRAEDIRFSDKEPGSLAELQHMIRYGPQYDDIPRDEPTPKDLKETSMSILSGLDMQKISKPARSFLGGLSPKGKGIGQEIERWLASPEWFQNKAMKEIVDHSLNKAEKYHSLFNDFNAVEDPMAEHDTVAKTLEVLARKGKISKAAFIMGRRSKEYKQLETILDEADVYNTKPTQEGLKEKGYSADVIQAWTVVRESYDKQLDARLQPMKDLITRIEEQAAFSGEKPVYPAFGNFIIDGKSRDLNLKEAIMEMGELRGTYSPRLRNPGEYVVTGMRDGEYFRDNRRTKAFANLLRDKLEGEGYSGVKVKREARLPEETFQAVRIAEMGTVIKTATEKGTKNVDAERRMAIMDEIMLAASDTLKSRGSKSIMIRRQAGPPVKGYITDPLIRYVRYTSSNSAGLAKAEMAEKMIKSLYGEFQNGIQVGGIDAAKDPETHSMARSYIEEQMRNAETGDRVIGLLKGLTTLKFLGFNPRSVLVNLTALTTSAPMALHAYVKDGKGSLSMVGVELSKGVKDYTKVMAGKRLPNQDEMVFLDSFAANGYTDAQYTRDATGVISGTYGTAWSKLMSGSMYVFGKSEQWVRGGTALAAYRIARKEGLNHTDGEVKAINATSKAHGTYGKETLPMVAWGKGVGRLGQAFYTYMKFPHNYMQMLYDVGVRKHNMKGVIFGMAAPAVLGGVAAVPMYATVMACANAMLAAVDDDRDAEKFVYDIINEYLGEDAEENIRGGVLGLVGVDIGGSLSMGPGSIPTSLFELTGAVGGMVEDAYKGAKHVAAGELGRAAEKIAPKFIGNVFLAIREMKGATTSRGDRIWTEDGEPYIPTLEETVKRGVGFRSAKRAQLGQTTWISKREERRFKETSAKIYQQVKFSAARPEDDKAKKDIADEISKYNKNALQTSNVPLITPASIERQMVKMEAPTSKQMGRLTTEKRDLQFQSDIWGGSLGVVSKMDTTQKEVKRLSGLGLLKYSSPPSRSIDMGRGLRIKLDSEQYARYTGDVSTLVAERVKYVMDSVSWDNLTDKQRVYAIRRASKRGRTFVRDQLKRSLRAAGIKGE